MVSQIQPSDRCVTTQLHVGFGLHSIDWLTKEIIGDKTRVIRLTHYSNVDEMYFTDDLVLHSHTHTPLST